MFASAFLPIKMVSHSLSLPEVNNQLSRANIESKMVVLVLINQVINLLYSDTSLHVRHSISSANIKMPLEPSGSTILDVEKVKLGTVCSSELSMCS